MKLKEKHIEIGNHYMRFIDRKRFPLFELSDSVLLTFIKIESCGRGGISESDLVACEPLLNCKVNKELTIRMLWEEMAEWWSNGNGWFYPIAHAIQEEFKIRSLDKIHIRALIKIMRSIKRRGFAESLVRFTGIPEESKRVIIERFFSSCRSQLT